MSLSSDEAKGSSLLLLVVYQRGQITIDLTPWLPLNLRPQSTQSNILIRIKNRIII